MANIFDYMQWRDIPLTKTEFNEIDNLILARFSYFPLDEKIMENDEKITIKESYERYNKKGTTARILQKEDVDLFELTREIVSRLSLTAAQRNIHMELTGESVKIHGIRQILDEMIYNITENAVKYNKENGNVTIWVGNTLEGPKVRVSDTGIGIPKEHQDRIFERFYRVDKSHSKERGGTGLGLSIVKHGAILHGAKVQVDSEYGKGTRMEIIFPEK